MAKKKIDIKGVIAKAKAKAELAKDKAAIAKNQPKLPKLPDPLADVDYTQGVEGSAKEELSATLTAFKDRAKQEQKRFELATDSEFWFAVGFQSRDQKEAFLKALEWLKYGDKYLDGTLIARQMDIEIPQVRLSNVKNKRDKKLAPLVRKM